MESEHDILPAEPSIELKPLLEYSGPVQISPWQTSFRRFRMEKRDGELTLLERTWEQCKSNDLIVRLGPRKLHCNRTLFMSYSEWAEHKLKNGLHELHLPEDQVPYEGLATLCAWMEKSHTVLDCAHLMAVLAAATFLRVQALSRQVWLCLDLPQGIKEDRAFKVAMDASSIHALACYRGLDTTILRRVQCFFLTLVASKEFLLLPPQNVCSLLSADVAVNSEKEVFFAAVRWLTHDWAGRCKYLEPIMESVRLAQLPTQYLRQLQTGTNEPAVDLVVGHPVFVELLRKALYALEDLSPFSAFLTVSLLSLSLLVQFIYFSPTTMAPKYMVSSTKPCI